MSQVMLKDIGLKEYTLDNLDILRELRDVHFKSRSEICVERAKYVTEYLREKDNPQDAPVIRRAKTVNYFLSNKSAVFPDNNLIAGTTTSKAMGAPLYPEFFALTIWPELETISTRKSNPQLLSKEEADLLNFEIYPFWMERNVLEVTRKRYNNPQCMKLFEQLIFFVASKAGCISHTVPCYSVVLDKGLNYIIQEAADKESEISKNTPLSDEDQEKLNFYKAVQTVLKGIIDYANNLSRAAIELSKTVSDPVRKKSLEKMAEVCGRVPANPASTFHEAVNSLWISHISIHAENINMAMSPGRLDQILYKYYRKDMDEGRLTIKEAMELVGCLWLKLADNVNMVPETAEELFGGAGTAPAVTLGGVDANGEDAVNDLTYIMLRVTELLKTRDPSMNARYNYEKNSKEYRDRVCEVIANTKAVPAFHNDITDIKTLENQGTLTEHARDYAIIGCVELASSGRSYDASSSVMLNLVAPLELTLYNGKRPATGDEQIGPNTGDPSRFKSFEEFWEAFKGQLKWLIGEAVQLNEYFGKIHQEVVPTPLLSAYFEGPMEKGKDLIFGGALYNSSGATHIGFADTVDSLNAIEKAVFIDKKCTFTELLAALKANFQGYESLHQYLVNKAPKYGTEDPVAIKNSQNLICFLYELYQSRVNYRGGKYRPAYWSMTNHSGQGGLANALPNGRKAGEPFASGITPVSGAAKELTACLKTIGGLDSLCIPGGEALNLKFTTVENESDIEKFGQIIESYFRLGGMQVQFNIMSYETLIDAKNHPEKYPGLMVRVSGYSAYFKDLNDKMKDELIKRTEYNLRTGAAVPFPGFK
ncbi:MAG: formate acetyltransferase [Clostridia bacterium]|nr:formate acetyltransferase [Clostridia bacterium]